MAMAVNDVDVLGRLRNYLDVASEQLRDDLDVGGAFRRSSGAGPDALDLNLVDTLERNGQVEAGDNAVQSVENAVLDSIGHDLLVFLAVSAIATPLARIAKLTPILVYLVLGAILGPHGIGVLQSAKADLELGDFGILFLLFSEGLEVTTERLKQLTFYLPLGFAQVSMTAGILTLGILGGAMQRLESFLPLDTGLIDITNPIEALVLALAGTLSTSAFIFPVLKERGWEKQASGRAATSILLLQDLLVAPLLVLLPFLVGKGLNDPTAVAELTLKATVGFGSVLATGSFIIRYLFELAAKVRSTDTFVALSLLVAVGMGAIAKNLGLTDTAGAFAAGVLLANSNYKYEISAAVAPFKGILLGCFFLTAGSDFDPDLLIREGPTVATGVTALVLLKALTLGAAAQIDRFLPTASDIPTADIVRLAVLLSGGGEFAFVVLASAEKLGLLPADLGGLLTTIVLISMGVTPLLGDAAEALSASFVDEDRPEPMSNATETSDVAVASDAIVICGYGEIGSSISRVLMETTESRFVEECSQRASGEPSLQNASALPSIVCFDLNPSRLPRGITETSNTLVMYGDGSNGELVRSTGVTAPRAIIITYEDPERRVSATQRLHTFFPDSPIYVRAAGMEERRELVANGASATISESQELAVQLGACLFLDEDAFKIRQADSSRDAPPSLSVWEEAVRALRAAVEEDGIPAVEEDGIPCRTEDEAEK